LDLRRTATVMTDKWRYWGVGASCHMVFLKFFAPKREQNWSYHF